MRPRQSSLGIGRREVAQGAGVHSFNEAEAIKPRNRGRVGEATAMVQVLQ